jgi:ABC-type lipoprotein release transport system permease subunit
MLPFSYNTRSLFVRRSATILTIVGIGSTVAVLAGILSLQQGFASLFTEAGAEDIVVFMRPGATSEGQSAFQPDRAEILMKSLAEIEETPDGLPMASGEMFLAVRRNKKEGGETNVPIRGIQQMTMTLRGESLRLLDGRPFTQGMDEAIVGHSLSNRIQDCNLGDVIQLNTTPFRVVGIFESDGPFDSEIWGDIDRLSAALDRPIYSRIVARIKPGTDVEALRVRLEEDKQVPATVMTEREYLTKQTEMLSQALIVLGSFLAFVMGTAAVFTGTNTMLAALAARTHEIGILLALGFRPVAVFFSFLLEALLMGLCGGLVGILMALPLNGVRTGTTNFQTFTELAFAFRVTPQVLTTAVCFSVLLGLLGGAWPAWRAARLKPSIAMRRQ